MAIVGAVVLCEAQLGAGVSGFGGGDGLGKSGDLAGVAGIGFIHSQVEQFGATGDAELVKNAEEVILDGVGAKVQSLGDIAVGHAAGDGLDDLALADGEKIHPFVVGGVNARGAGQGFESVIEFDAACPDLAFVDSADTFAE